MISHNCTVALPITWCLHIHKQPVDVLQRFKYLGTITDWALRFNETSGSIFRRANQWLLLIRKLRSFSVSQQKLMAHKALAAFDSYNTTWVWRPSFLLKLVNIAGNVVSKPQEELCNETRHICGWFSSTKLLNLSFSHLAVDSGPWSVCYYGVYCEIYTKLERDGERERERLLSTTQG